MSPFLGPIVAASLCTATAMAAQTTTLGVGAGGSPRVRSEWRVAGAKIVVEYGRPSLRGRREEDMMPAGRPWRTGADIATILRTDRALQFGKLKLEPGSYTLSTQPGQVWELIFGRLSAEGQWGSPYQQALELHRFPMFTSVNAKPVEQLTISIEVNKAGGSLRIDWGKVRASASFFVVGRSSTSDALPRVAPISEPR